jgi:TfoX/Sxy family transcriptional regulator of competence genes
MEWKKASGQLTLLLEELLVPFACERKKMFGCPAYFVNGNMFTGVFAESIFFRFPEAERKKLLESESGVEQFAPVEGRVMREYVSLSGTAAMDRDRVQRLLALSWEYTLGLPLKKTRKKP